MGRIVAVINQKGGVGKTTTAVNMGAVLAAKGYRVLLADLDPQCNLSYSVGGEFDGEATVLELLLKQKPIQECIQKLPAFDLIGGNSSLAGIAEVLRESGKEYTLREALAPVKGLYDFILIDSPPALSLITVNALTAADSFIITAQSDIFSMQGIGQLYGTYLTVKECSNPDIKIDGILLTRNVDRFLFSRKSSNEMKEMAEEIGTILFDARIHESVKVREAAALQKTLTEYAPKSRPARDYEEFTEEYLRRMGEKR